MSDSDVLKAYYTTYEISFIFCLLCMLRMSGAKLMFEADRLFSH